MNKLFFDGNTINTKTNQASSLLLYCSAIYPYCVYVVSLQGYQPNTWLKYDTPYSIALSMNQKCLVIFF